MPLPVERVICTLDLHEKCVSSRFEVAVESPVEFAGVRVVPAFDLGKPRKLRPACGAKSCRVKRTAAIFAFLRDQLWRRRWRASFEPEG